MFGKTPSFESLMARLENQLKPEFAQFLRDLAKQRAGKFALECLVDGLNDTAAAIPADVARDLEQACRAAGVDEQRRALVRQLAVRRGGLVTGPEGATGFSVADLVAAEDPVALGRAHGISEVMIVRALREKHGLTSSEAVALMRMVPPKG